MCVAEPKPSVTEEQIELAKQVDVLDYLLAFEKDNLTQSGNEYRLKDHDSLTISNGCWHWHSRGFGGKSATALNFLIKVREMDFVGAVEHLAGCAPPPSHGSSQDAPKKRRFRLPARNKSKERVIAYLQSRDIDRELIQACIDRGVLYESVGTHNCVFTGKNEQGHTRFACMRATVGSYKRDADGSDKRYGFLLPPADPANRHRVAVFEAPIDALSHQTMNKRGYITWDGWRLALSGTSLLSLEFFLKTHPNVVECLICTDLDEPGHRLADKMLALPRQGERYKRMVFARSRPPHGNDFNQALQRLNKIQNRHTHRRSEPYL